MTNLLNYKNFQKARRCFPSLLALCLMGVVFLPAAAQAQSTRELNGRLNQLESEVRSLKRLSDAAGSGYTGGNTDARANADMVVQLQEMERELSALRGKFEEQGYEVRQLREELRRVSEDMALRIEDLEKGRGADNQVQAQGGLKYTSRSPSVTTQEPQEQEEDSETGGGSASYQWGSKGSAGNLGSYSQSPTGEISGDADEAAVMYESAFSLLKGNQYEAAQKDFEAFLSAYPDHVLAGNAQYWLGETHYVRGDFENAAKVFAVGYQKYPKGSKAADNLLKLGMSLSALGKKNDACIALEQIGKEGFQGAGPVLRRAEQEQSRLNCS